MLRSDNDSVGKVKRSLKLEKLHAETLEGASERYDSRRRSSVEDERKISGRDRGRGRVGARVGTVIDGFEAVVSAALRSECASSEAIRGSVEVVVVVVLLTTAPVEAGHGDDAWNSVARRRCR